MHPHTLVFARPTLQFECEWMNTLADWSNSIFPYCLSVYNNPYWRKAPTRLCKSSSSRMRTRSRTRTSPCCWNTSSWPASGGWASSGWVIPHFFLLPLSNSHFLISEQHAQYGSFIAHTLKDKNHLVSPYRKTHSWFAQHVYSKTHNKKPPASPLPRYRRALFAHDRAREKALLSFT